MISKKLIEYLLNENPEYSRITIPEYEQEQFQLYRSLVNIRPAMPVSPDYIDTENKFLKDLTLKKGITDIADLQPVEDNIYLWQGDITTLKCGAIVNAGNSGLTGCYQPCHNCIDNCIHTFAGVGLRLECAEIMRKQGHDEPTGQAKITSAKEDGTRIKGFHNTFKRMVWNQPCPARTTYCGSISSHNNVHPGYLQEDGTYSDPRVLTLLETFIVSSIPEDIDFPEGSTDTFIRTIIGEAIPPRLMERIIELIGVE